jgi:hypothetical protein
LQDNLEYMTLCSSLCDPETHDGFQLRKRFAFFNLSARYEYVLIDTPPGFGSVHELAINASDDIVLPTDLTPISLSVVERFCNDFESRPGISAVCCTVLRYFVRPSNDVYLGHAVIHEKIVSHIVPHFVAADERIRAVTSGCGDFLKQPLPRRIVSQLVLFAADVLHADRTRLEKAVDALCGPDDKETPKELKALVSDDLINIPPPTILATDVSIAAS